MMEIRIHGRGGQGAVTSGQLLAIAAFYDKKQSQAFPMFGVERTGAPVQSFVRISNEKINIRSQVYEPDIVVVLDPSLIEAVNVTEGLKKNGWIIINTNNPKNINIKGDYKICNVDAFSIASEIFGKPIVNTLMLGAVSFATNLVSLDSLKKAVDDVFLKTKGKDIADKNKRAIEEAYKNSKISKCALH